LRGVQTGRIQQYLMFALVLFMLVGAALFFYFRYFRLVA
jgi:LPXTG-motif cell wall-anchored protein